MGFWGDVWDGVKTIATAPFQLAAAPFELAADIIQGKNVGDASLDFLKHEVGSAVTIAGGPASAFFGTETGQGILNNETLSKLSLGYSSDYAHSVSGAKSAAFDATISHDDLIGSARFLAKTAAIGGGAAIAGSGLTVAGHTVSLTEGIAGLGVGSQLIKGDVGGALGALGVPGAEQFGDAAKSVNNFFGANAPAQPGPAAPPPPPYISEAASTSSGFSGPGSKPGASASASGGLLMVAVAAGGLFILTRKKP